MPQTELRYRAFGLNIVSDWPLPSLATADFETPDLSILHEAVGSHLGADWSENRKTFANWEAMPGKFLMKVTGVASFLALDGKMLLIERENDAVGDDAVTAYMMGSMMAAILQQRGKSLLHSSAVEICGKAAVFAGPSGMGKSTLAARLVQAGHALIADDVVALTQDQSGRFCATPSFPTSRLWDDALGKLSLEEKTSSRVRPELDKYLLPSESYCDTPRPIGAIYILKQDNQSEVTIERVPLRDAHHRLNMQGFRKGFLKGHKMLPQHFKTMIALARQVPAFSVLRPRDGFALDQLADAVTTHAQKFADQAV